MEAAAAVVACVVEVCGVEVDAVLRWVVVDLRETTPADRLIAGNQAVARDQAIWRDLVQIPDPLAVSWAEESGPVLEAGRAVDNSPERHDREPALGPLKGSSISFSISRAQAIDHLLGSMEVSLDQPLRVDWPEGLLPIFSTTMALRDNDLPKGQEQGKDQILPIGLASEEGPIWVKDRLLVRVQEQVLARVQTCVQEIENAPE